MSSTRTDARQQHHSFGRGVGLLLAALGAMAVLTGVLVSMARQASADIERQADINAELPALRHVLIELLNAETGQRGYLLTSRRSYLEPYLDTLESLDAKVQALRSRRVAGSAALDRLRELAGLKLAELTTTIMLHDAGQSAEALALVSGGTGKRQMDEMRQILRDETERLTAERDVLSRRLAHEASQTRLLLLVGLGLLALFATLALWQVLTGARRLRATEHQLRSIADSVPALITQFDREGRLTFANAQVGTVYGVDHLSLVGKRIGDVRGAPTAAALQPHVDRVLQGEPVQFESEAVIDSELRHFRQSYVPDLDLDGEVQGFFSVSFDISEAKTSADRLRAITDNLPVLITYLDAELRLRSVNATFQEWLGIDPATVLGRPLREVIGEPLFAQRGQQLARALAGERQEFEICSTANGVTRHVQNLYVPHRLADGRVVGIYALSTDITVMKLAELRLAELARSDGLTGLPNRRQFDERLEQALARCRREAGALALLFLDIDHFKAVNDGHGHAAGDAVLKAFAQRLLSCVRGTDTVARLAGDEFVVILEGLAEAADASAVAGKILRCMKEPVQVELLQLPVSTSIGLVLQRDGDITPQALMAHADRALYRAKRDGRNRCAVHVA